MITLSRFEVSSYDIEMDGNRHTVYKFKVVVDLELHGRTLATCLKGTVRVIWRSNVREIHLESVELC